MKKGSWRPGEKKGGEGAGKRTEPSVNRVKETRWRWQLERGGKWEIE